MKALAIWFISGLAAAVSASAQGTVNFSNRVPADNLNAPVGYADWNGVQWRLGSDYLVQLYAGTEATSLTPVGTAIAFRNGTAAGYFFGGQLEVPFLAPSSGGWFQIRFWLGSLGPSFEAAMAHGGQAGVSNTFFLGSLGDPNAVPPSVPVSLVGPQPSNIYLIPEGSTLALLAVGALLIPWRGR